MSQTVPPETVVKYQFQIDEEKWTEWKRTVPRDKSLEDRLIELIEADTEGRVTETADDDDEELRSDGIGQIVRKDSSSDPIAEALEGWRPGRGPDDRTERVASARQLLEWLRDQDRLIQRAEIEQEIGDDLMLDDQTEFVDGFWKCVGLPAIRRARDADLVELEGNSYLWVDE